MVGFRDLPCGEDKILGQLDGASAASVQEPRHMPSLHLVLPGELGGASAQKLGQCLPRGFQSVSVLHKQMVMEISSDF